MGSPLFLASTGLYVVVGIAVVVIGIVIAYYAARFMKGSLKLELARDSVSSGDFLSGTIDLEAKKQIHGMLKVSLVGREKRRKRRAGSDNDTTEMVEVYREDTVLEETRDFEAGFRERYSFELVAPTRSEARAGHRVVNAMADAIGEGVISGAVKAAAKLDSLMSGRIYWHVETRLDADGVDLYDKEKCRVNLRD